MSKGVSMRSSWLGGGEFGTEGGMDSAKSEDVRPFLLFSWGISGLFF